MRVGGLILFRTDLMFIDLVMVDSPFWMVNSLFCLAMAATAIAVTGLQ